MSMNELRDLLQTLPVQDRAELAKMLLDSLHDDEEFPTVSEEEFNQELLRRMEEMESGKVAGIPAEEVFEEMRRKYP